MPCTYKYRSLLITSSDFAELTKGSSESEVQCDAKEYNHENDPAASAASLEYFGLVLEADAAVHAMMIRSRPASSLGSVHLTHEAIATKVLAADIH